MFDTQCRPIQLLLDDEGGRIAAAVARYRDVIARAIETMEDPDDIASRNGEAWRGVPGTGDYSVVDFCGNALVVSEREDMQWIDGKRQRISELSISYLPGWFLQTIIRSYLTDGLDLRLPPAPDNISFEETAASFRGEIVLVPVQALDKAWPRQIVLRVERPLPGQRPYHYHYQGSHWSCASRVNFQRADESLLEELTVEAIEWSPPRLVCSVSEGVSFVNKGIMSSAAARLQRLFAPHNMCVRGEQPTTWARQMLNVEFRRFRVGDPMPAGAGRRPSAFAEYSIEDFLPPAPGVLVQREAFADALLAAVNPQDEPAPTDEYGMPLQSDSSTTGSDPDSGSGSPVEIPGAAASEPAGAGGPELFRMLSDVPYRRYLRPTGEAFALFPRKRIMDAARDDRSRFDLFMSEYDWLSAPAQMLSWLGSPDNYSPVFDDQPLLIEINHQDPGSADGRFEIVVIPYDDEGKPQQPPYDLSKLPIKPPWYRVIIQTTQGVRVGYRAATALNEFIKGGGAYVDVALYESAFDEFGRLWARGGPTDSEFKRGHQVLAPVNPEDLLPAMRNLGGSMTDGAMMVLAFTPYTLVTDVYDAANLIAYLATVDNTGRGYDVWGRNMTGTDAAMMAIGLLPLVTSGHVRTGVLLFSGGMFAKDMSLLAYMAGTADYSSGSLAQSVSMADAEALRNKLLESNR